MIDIFKKLQYNTLLLLRIVIFWEITFSLKKKKKYSILAIMHFFLLFRYSNHLGITLIMSYTLKPHHQCLAFLQKKKKKRFYLI